MPDSNQEIPYIADQGLNARIKIDVPYIDPPPPSTVHLDSEKSKIKSNSIYTNPSKTNLKICSWNVASIRALIKKGGFDYLKQEDPDIIALQEVKCDPENLPCEAKPAGYFHYYLEGEQKEYCGVALLSKIKPLNILFDLENANLDVEARVITAEYDTIIVVNVYAPFSGDGLLNLPKRLEWDLSFRNFVNKLNRDKTIIICGDLNVAHQEIDLSEPRKNSGPAGFTYQERDGMTELLKQGFVDSFRFLYPHRNNSYSFWLYGNNNREKNIGWRLDYFLVSEEMKSRILDSVIKNDIFGSDHCPIVLLLHLENTRMDSTNSLLYPAPNGKTCVTHQWTEPLTYKKDNYAHFISEDCEPTNSIAKLLVATDRLDLQDLRECRSIKGQILATPHGRYKTYSIVVKKRHNDDLDWKDVTRGLKNLHLALNQDGQTTCRMANSGDLLGSLPQNKMAELLAEIFRCGTILITLCHGRIEVPPDELRPDIIAEYHGSLIGGHKGVTKTYRRIRERYTWPRLRDEVTEYIKGCKSCLEQKLVRARTREPMLITDTPAEPFDKVSLDTVGKLPTTPNGNRHILTMQDKFSKFCIAVPIPDLKTTTVAHAVETHLFSQYGSPRFILTDRGGSFISRLMKKLEGIFKVKQLTTSGYRPQTNGSLECSHIVLTDYIKHYATDYDDWDRLLPFAMFAYNTSVHEATNFTPYELVFGRVARTPSSFPQGEEIETYGTYLRDLIVRVTEIRRLAYFVVLFTKFHEPFPLIDHSILG